MSLSWRYAAISDTGRSRKNNQDSGYAGEHLIAVADGMGGAAAGDLASSIVVSTIRRLDDQATRYRSAGDRLSGDGAGSGDGHADGSSDEANDVGANRTVGDDLLEAMAGAVLRANDRLGEIVESDPTVDGMGTTATAIVIADSRAGLVHIGDSRAYLLRGQRLQRLTEDHTLVQSLVDEGRISSDEARHHPHRSVILRALDGRQEIQPDLGLLDLEAGDRLLVCSDGLCGFADDEQIGRVLGSGTVDSAALDLLQLALDSDSTDNVTCIVAEVVDGAVATESPAPAPERGVGDTADQALAAVGTGPMLVGAVAEESRAHALATAPPRHRGRPQEGDHDAGEQSADDEQEEQRYAPQAPGRFRRLRGVLATLLALAVLAGAAYLAYGWSQRQYYVAESAGSVAIYRGVQLDLPGLTLSREYQQTAVPVADLPDYNAQQVAEGMDATDLEDARALVIRLDDLARQCARSRSTTAECEGAGQQADTDSSPSPSEPPTSEPTSGPTSEPTSGPTSGQTSQESAGSGNDQPSATRSGGRG